MKAIVKGSFLSFCFLLSACVLPKLADSFFINNNQQLDCVITGTTPKEPIVYYFNISGYSTGGAASKSDFQFNDFIDDKGTPNPSDDIVYAKGYFLDGQSFDAIVIPVRLKSGKEALSAVKMGDLKIKYEQKMYRFSAGNTTWDSSVSPDSSWTEGKKGDAIFSPAFAYVYGSNSWKGGKYLSASLSSEELGFFVFPLGRSDVSALKNYLKSPVITSQEEYERFKPNGGDYIACRLTASAKLTFSKEGYHAPSATAIPTAISAEADQYEITVENRDDEVSVQLESRYGMLFFYSLIGSEVIPKYVIGFPEKATEITNGGIIPPQNSVTVTLSHSGLPQIECEYAHPYFSYSETKMKK